MRVLGILDEITIIFSVAHQSPFHASSSHLLGFSRHGTYLNCRGIDISAHTAKIDYLFTEKSACETFFHNYYQSRLNQRNTHTFYMPATLSIGIGDGGNEIGMGNITRVLPNMHTLHPMLPVDPCVTTADHIIVASTSNWGMCVNYVLLLSLFVPTQTLV